MTKKQIKFFFIFWLISAVAWLAGGIRHIVVSEDIVGAIIFFAASATSTILVFKFHKASE